MSIVHGTANLMQYNIQFSYKYSIAIQQTEGMTLFLLLSILIITVIPLLFYDLYVNM